MIDYHVEDYSQNCALYLRDFERGMIEKIKSFLNEAKGLKCVLRLELAERRINENCLLLGSNASFALNGSYDVFNKVKKFCELQNSEMNKFIDPKHRLIVYLDFSKSVEEQRDGKNPSQSVNSDTPQFTAQKPIYTFSQIILDDKIREEIFTALNVLKYQDLIYNDWGFKEIDPVPKSVLNFYGPAGTGKTMCAHAIAHELEKPLLALNYAEIESKYVGDAPKNLMTAFNAAKKEDAVLFFDEADSFLGKRIQNISQGADQALNSLRSQMLILLEQHSGIIVFATNLVTNFDSAFESRILKHIKFELPNLEARVAIIKKMIPDKLPLKEPLKEEQFKELSEISDGFSGRELKGVILETMLDKASKMGENAIFEFEDFRSRFEYKRDERKRLKDEATAETKAKIERALLKKGVEISNDNAPSAADKEEDNDTVNNNTVNNDTANKE